MVEKGPAVVFHYYLLFFLCTAALYSNDFCSPSARILEREGEHTVKKKMLWLGVPEALFPLIEEIAATEEWGHVGYHGSCQEYRIYQDVIRFLVEEILEIPLRKDFHFLRIPGDADLHLNSTADFFSYWGIHINNKTPLRAKQLMSWNYGIYSNYAVYGSSSPLIFATGNSHDALDYEALLYPFCEELGISQSVLTDLFKIARTHLKKQEGILLQMRDFSHERDYVTAVYALADTQCYPSSGRSFRWGKRVLSEEYACVISQDYLSKKAEIAPQLSLIVNNRYTLNPFSSFSIRRWDFYTSNEIASYESAMRNALRAVQKNTAKIQVYRQHLFTLWQEAY